MSSATSHGSSAVVLLCAVKLLVVLSMPWLASSDNSAITVSKLVIDGKSPSFRLYPDENDTSNFIKVRFGKIEERDSQGKKIPAHSISSLAGLNAGVIEGSAIVNGTNVTYAQIIVSLEQVGQNFKSCSGDHTMATVTNVADSSASKVQQVVKSKSTTFSSVVTSANDSAQSAINGSSSGSVVISCYIPRADLSFPYGANNTAHVLRNSLKFNVEVLNWPFCSSANSLAVEIILNSGNAQAPKTKTDQEGGPIGSRHDLHSMSSSRVRLESGKGKLSAVTFPSYATDGPTGNQTFNISMVQTDKGKKTGFTLIFPAATSIYYDPTISSDTTTTPTTIGVSNTSKHAHTVPHLLTLFVIMIFMFIC